MEKENNQLFEKINQLLIIIANAKETEDKLIDQNWNIEDELYWDIK